MKTLLGFICPPRMKSLQDKVAVVVGASRGIGREIAIQLAELGAIPICLDIDQVENKALVKSLRDQGFEAFGYTCDIRERENVRRTIEFIDREVGDISMYFHCCGVPSPRSLVSNPPPLQETMNISVLSHFYVSFFCFFFFNFN